MTSKEIRNQFLDFFKNKGHKIVPSAPVIPYDDPTLLFTNAGMNQFKDVFLGKGTRDYTRAADTQKCIRVSGKHNDLEEVGYDTYHHTFFEMLGNWSFGDYYKEEAIEWAWELLTEVWKLPKERLWATVFRTDDEAFEIWKKKTDINPKHILRFDEKDNFWEMGETGPCGPSSEIHINLGDDFDNPALVNAGSEECIEIWNLVFIQYNKDKEGKLHDLPMRHVDTGMGFERICAVLQGKRSNYDTDIFSPLISSVERLSGRSYDKGSNAIPMRVIADHIRTLSFAIADGAVPGNEGRGYVLRRILRRAARYGRKLELNEPFLFKLVPVLIEILGEVFPEIKTNRENIEKIIKAEEESFNATLDRGISLFEEVSAKCLKEGKKVIDGESVFKLYDTFGFPVDLTKVMAKEKGLEIEEEKFNELMTAQKERARKSTKEKIADANIIVDKFGALDIERFPTTEFVGYDYLKTEAEVLDVKTKENETFLLLDKTPFYTEAGGQVDDKGVIIVGENRYEVKDLIKFKNRIVHILDNPKNEQIPVGAKVIASVNERERWDTMRNHSATHFLHAALRQILGSHVRQAGSYVGPERLRFDFSHYSKLSESEIKEIEELINEKILENLELKHYRNIPFDEAKKMGALMFFGDKYGERVNVVRFGDFTMEFCGGTHVKNSSQIGLFKIVSETSIASGVRRIEAVTGRGVVKFIENKIDELREAERKAEKALEEKKKLEKKIAEIQLKEKLGKTDVLLKEKKEVKGIAVFAGKVEAESMNELKSFGDEIRNKMRSGVALIVANLDGKVGMVCVVSDDLIKGKNLSAGKIVGKAAKVVGGGGGGRPHLATAGGRDASKIKDLIEEFPNIVSSFL